jgi:type III secretion system-like peptide-binding chaperone
MSEQLWIRSHVERLLQSEWNACRVLVDDDGDYPFRLGTAACWVRVVDENPIMVRVFAHAALDVKPSLKLFHELNSIQQRTLSAAAFWQDGTVMVSQTISPIGLTAPVLAQAMKAVGGVADDVGLLLAGVYGGRTPHPAVVETDGADEGAT